MIVIRGKWDRLAQLMGYAWNTGTCPRRAAATPGLRVIRFVVTVNGLAEPVSEAKTQRPPLTTSTMGRAADALMVIGPSPRTPPPAILPPSPSGLTVPAPQSAAPHQRKLSGRHSPMQFSSADFPRIHATPSTRGGARMMRH